MPDSLFENAAFMRHALDAIPSMVLVTDEDARILYRNLAARELLAGEKIYGMRVGEVMHCVHSTDVPAGCGRGPRCADCIVRRSVNAALSGQAFRRERTDITVTMRGKTLAVPALVSSSPFTFSEKLHALLVIEDISELAELRALLPICSSCKKIRTEDGSWEKVEVYIRAHVPEVNLSHGLCPDCARKLYPSHSD
ncbi:MAG: PAS domain-containing protein [Elusimicrobiales bacterium]|nr:PAS domain-containing protein [Elusimicrobiales bacterium]